MTRNTVRAWSVVHKWTSLVSTAFMLMLCVTGLPLIFHHEIDEIFETHGAYEAPPLGTPTLSLDTMLATALAGRGGEVPLYLSFDEDRPVVNFTTGPRSNASDKEMHFASFDWTSAQALPPHQEGGVMDVLLTLHVDMFMGLPGTLFLGFMGLVVFAAIVSGVVLYAPFMRKLDFGVVRVTRSSRVKWLDYHNLLGVVTVAWLSVVTLTGSINTLSTPIIQLWQADQLAEMTAPYKHLPPASAEASIQEAVDTALAAAPGMRVQFVAFPGVAYSTEHHYAVFMQGATPLTKHLLTPALIDARTGELTAIRQMPWYAQALLLSGPLHFGDYGGLPLKILWALLDIATIIVLVSGLYLWLSRRRAPATDPVVAQLREQPALAPAE
ncbi:PepSY domain-containing protein [Phenylobacterium sp.]|uniref:PepSY-associated TM helix domain-containing protein n=1 Tax=Phenylobacterium sp. TaxID=1871053 RepID=UPI002730A5C4|nr:PepSY-associated TM helix domain-containing protein [Phenylobacterium sp.]MDP1619297.1 PepSY-associated TM helix domain-containing protein [Phenylobacterium sp.]MDP1987748.1 PepSY-associated TM helix domain-containing protein [Phenylobacterium sp.]